MARAIRKSMYFKYKSNSSKCLNDDTLNLVFSTVCLVIIDQKLITFNMTKLKLHLPYMYVTLGCTHQPGNQYQCNLI